MEVGSSSLPGTTHRSETNVFQGSSDLGLPKENGGLAQLARAPALQAGGQRFESVILHVVREDRRSRSETRQRSGGSHRRSLTC